MVFAVWVVAVLGCVLMDSWEKVQRSETGKRRGGLERVSNRDGNERE